MNDAERAAQLVDAGVWMRLSGDLDGARKLFERALKLDPSNVKAREFLELADGGSPFAEPGRKLGALLDEALSMTSGAAAPTPGAAAQEPGLVPQGTGRSSLGGGGAPEWGAPSAAGAAPAAGAESNGSPPPATFTPSALFRDYGRAGAANSTEDRKANGVPAEPPRAKERGNTPVPSSPSTLLREYDAASAAAAPARRAGAAAGREVAGRAPARDQAPARPAPRPADAEPPRPGPDEELELPRMVVTAVGAPSYAPPPRATEAGPGPARAATPSPSLPAAGAPAGRLSDEPLGLGSLVVSEPAESRSASTPAQLGMSGVVRIDGRGSRASEPSLPAVESSPGAPKPPSFGGFTLSPLPRPAPGLAAPIPTPPSPTQLPPSAEADPSDPPAWTWRRAADAAPGAPSQAPAKEPRIAARPSGGAPPAPPQASPAVGSAWDRTGPPSGSNGGARVAPVAFDFLASPPQPSSGSSGSRRRAGEVKLLVRDAKARLEFDDHSGAMELVLKALALDPQSQELRALKERSERTLTAMYESKIGNMSAKPRVLLKDDEVIWLNLDHRAGFVLAQIDGSVSFEDIFSVSGMSHFDTARILAQLIDEGVISNG